MTSYRYNHRGDLMEALAHHSGELQRTRIFYDEKWRPKLIELEEPPGHRTSRLVNVFSPDGLLIQTDRLEQGDVLVQRTEYRYDDTHRLQSRRISYPQRTLKSPTRETRFHYDADGRLVLEEPQDGGPTVSYHYDHRGFVSQKQVGQTLYRHETDRFGNIFSRTRLDVADEPVVRTMTLFSFDCWDERDL